jgi:hypothetical protein
VTGKDGTPFADTALRARLFADTALCAARVAAALLGWRPAEFWAATPAELRTALGLDLDDGGAPASAELLTRLMEAFPDER